MSTIAHAVDDATRRRFLALARRSGFVEAPPYWVDRHIIGALDDSAGGISLVVRSIADRRVWDACFADEIDWHRGWRAYWEEAASQLGVQAGVGEGGDDVELQLYHGDGEAWGLGAGWPSELGRAELAARVRDRVEEARATGPVTAGLIAVRGDAENGADRPGVALVTSGPSGGAASASTIARRLRSHTVAGVARGAVRDGAAGLVRLIFAPELYGLEEGPSFGIDWNVWADAATLAPKLEWGTACLLWCDQVCKVIRNVEFIAGSLIEEVRFEFFRAEVVPRLPPQGRDGWCLEALAKVLGPAPEAPSGCAG